MRVIITLYLGLFMSLIAFTQTSKSTSAELIKKGIALHDESKFQEALYLYNQVSRNDSNYVWALVEKAISLNASGEYNISIDICKEGLSYKTGHNSYFYNNLGTAYDELGEKEKALETYQDAIKEFPYSHTLYFNLGITYEGLNNIDKAIEAYQKTIDLNIYYASPHYRLGMLLYSQGRLAPAMYALGFYVLLDNRSDRSREALKTLQELSNNPGEKENDYHAEDELLQELELILRSKLALNKKYKTISKLDDSYVKQLQVLCEKSPEIKDLNNFWIKTYAPYYRNLYASKFMEYHSYFVYSAYNNETINKWLNKNKSKNDEFIKWAQEQINNIRKYTIIDFNGKPYNAQQWFFDDNSINAIGNMQIVGNTELYTGPWIYMFNSGKVSAKGSRDDFGQRQGPWIWYHANGNIEQTSNFIDNKWNGINITYHENGIIKSEGNYKNDSLDGIYREYYPTGQLNHEALYKSGKIIGKELYYHDNGNLSAEYYYKNGVIDSIARFYHTNGKLSSVLEVSNQQRHGLSASYFENGNINVNGQYLNNLPVGNWKWYYETGEIMTDGTFNDQGKMEGLLTRYRKDGSIEQTENYKNDLLDGLLNEYDEAGKEYAEVDFVKNVNQKYKYFNPENPSEIYASGEIKNNKILFKTTYPNGSIRNEGTFTGEKRTGIWNYYNKNGSLDYSQVYSENEETSKADYFFPDKTIKSTEYLTNDSKNGEVKYYHRNGSILAIGNLIENQKDGDWHFSNPWNKIITKEYYVKNNPSGFQVYYNQDGTISSELYYNNGTRNRFIIYDTLGKAIQDISLQNGTGTLELKSFDGTKESIGSYKNGYMHGKYTYYFANGEIEIEKEYAYDNEQGTYKRYHSNRKLSIEGNFENGKKEGKWKYYYPDGTLKSHKNYKLDNADGEYKYYYESGKTLIYGNYKEDLRDGDFIYYAPNGEIQVKLIYKEGMLLSYTYQDKDGNLIEPIKLINETGTVTALYKSGNKSIEFEVVYGEYQNDFTIYYPNGNVLSSYKYKNNELNGKCIEYYENANIKSELDYQYDKLHGAGKYYYENGVIERTEYYLYGEKSGLWEYFDKNGNLLKTEKYKYGRKIL